MLTFVNGNLFDTPADIRINTVNCVGVMGKGVALAFKERYPSMFDDYKKACERGEVQPGRLHTWDSPEGTTVVNFPTKRDWREKSRYDDVEDGLRALHDYLKNRGTVRVTLPALGCGHGGLDWDRVSELIRDQLSDLEAEIYVFGPSASRSADRAAKVDDSDETRKLLAERGVRTVCENDSAFPLALRELGFTRLYVLGNKTILTDKWVSVLCSFQPTEREINAATMCAEGLADAGVVIGTGYGPKVERPVIQAALERSGRVVICIADGILQFKQRRDLRDVWDDDRIVVVSVSSPSQNWNRNAARDANCALVALSSSTLITDPEPKRWRALAKEVLRVRPIQVAYVDYQQDAADLRVMRELGAIPIRRSKDSGTPNMSAILDYVKGSVIREPARVDPVVEQVEQGVSAVRKSPSYPKRLIEVDLPIARISAHARREKSIRHGHISTLHIWWARRPLAACRAVICAALWPDPADPLCPQAFRDKAAELITAFAKKAATTKKLMETCSQESLARWEAIAKTGIPLDPTDEAHQNVLRFALLDFIADFANWDNPTVPDYLETSRSLTQAAHEALGGEPGTRPLVVDPFAGGGSIPLEALRVGADAFASDLNPVAVLLNKVVLEYIPKYGQRLADEVRKWGKWIKEQAEKELAEFYPKDPDGATPIAYLWARTIKCEGPGCGAEVPLMRSLWLAKKKTNARALRIVPNPKEKRVDFEIIENPKAKEVADGTVARGSATCPCCGYTTRVASVREQLKKRRGGSVDARLVCVVSTRPEQQGRCYRVPSVRDTEAVAHADNALGGHAQELPSELVSLNEIRRISVPIYGMERWGDLFNTRQILSLLTLSRLVGEIGSKATLEEAGLGDAVRTLLAFAISKHADLANALCRWEPVAQCPRQLFGRQAIGMVWDFAEGVTIGESSGAFGIQIERMEHVLNGIGSNWLSGSVHQACATSHPLPDDSAWAIVTDPPYYDAVPYSHLSDFFYVWLRRCLADIHPALFADDVVPKDTEIVVDRPHHLSTSTKDIVFYERELKRAFGEGRRVLRPDGIGTIVFASKTTASWEAILKATIDAGWTISASWPIDTEMGNRIAAQGQSRLASSVHIVCRPRENPDGSLREEIGEWRDVLAELPGTIHEWMPRLAEEGVVGADSIFACLGPALEIFSRYSRVEKASGEEATLREYLEHVWAAVSTEALSMIFKDADAAGLEPDARLTAMWLWTLGAGNGRANGNGNGPHPDPLPEGEGGPVKSTGYVLEFDAARKIAQGLGIHLEKSESFVEVKGDKARLLSVAERTKYLFGKDSTAPATTRRKKKSKQMSLFAELDEVEAAEGGATGELAGASPGSTTMDRVHQAMILFGTGRGEAMKRFLVEDGVGTDARFWKLAQSLSALYPRGTDEKRWVDGVLARKKGLGL